MLDNKEKSNTGFASDVLTLVGGTTLAQIISILLYPILTRLYGPEDFGVWAIFISLTSIIGVISCMRYEQSIMLAESEEEASTLLGLCFIILLTILFLTVPVIYCFKESISFALNSPLLQNYLWIVLPYILMNGVFLILNYWNTRHKNFKTLSITRIFSAFSMSGTQVSLGVIGLSTGFGLIAGNLMGHLVSSTILGVKIWKMRGEKIIVNTNYHKMIQGAKKYKKFPLIDSLSALLNTLSWQIPSFLLAFFFSPMVVGFYSLGFRILQLPMSFIGSAISQVFFQRSSQAKIDGNLDKLTEEIFRVLVVIGMYPILTLTIVGGDVFSVIFGNQWYEAGIYTQILSIWAFVWFVSSPLSLIYIVLEKQQFGLKYNIFNFITRLFSIIIGGLVGNARIALILFSISGIFVYGYLSLKMLHYSEVKYTTIKKILFFNFIKFIPNGIVLISLKLIGSTQFIIVLVSIFSIFLYYLYIIRTDSQLSTIFNRLGDKIV